MALEDQLRGWTGPSSTTEREKQDRTERMVRQAIAAHAPLDSRSLNIFAKGSYANNTNVRTDSDVDIAVKYTDALYSEESEPGLKPPGSPYEGIWTPAKLRSELVTAMELKFPGQVDSTGSTAIQINSSSARVDADVVPCFSFRRYMQNGTRDGTKIFKKNGDSIVNYPAQQLENGTSKNNRTSLSYKKCARLLKRVENAMAESGKFRELPSFFIECLTYNCPDEVFTQQTWTARLRGVLVFIFTQLQGDEPNKDDDRWLEVNECFYLFHPNQEWTRKDGRDFAYAAWNYFEFK